MEAITLVKDNWAKNFGSWTLFSYIFNVYARSATSFLKPTSSAKMKKHDDVVGFVHVQRAFLNFHILLRC